MMLVILEVAKFEDLLNKRVDSSQKVTLLILMTLPDTKGQLISKANFEVFI